MVEDAAMSCKIENVKCLKSAIKMNSSITSQNISSIHLNESYV